MPKKREASNVYDYVLRQKYSHSKDETWDDISKRVAKTLARPEESEKQYWQDKFYSVLKHKLFLCGGRILANAGRLKQGLFNCYICDVNDSIRGPEGWADTLKAATEIMSVGGGVGLSFDKLRPRGAKIRGVGGETNGSVAFMRSLDGLKYSISGGQNRGIALLFGQTLNHPDIIEFIRCKEQDGVISAANISIMVDDDAEFVENIDNPDYEIELVSAGNVYKKIKMAKIINLAIDNMLKNGEPGFINRALMNRESTIGYYAPICCTNPCGEIPGISYQNCCLGSIDLAKFVSSNGRTNWNLLKDVVRTAVRMLDNTYAVTHWPTEMIKYTNLKLRKIGIGIMGAHYYLIKKGIKYSDVSVSAPELAEIMKFITINAYWESVELAKEKGQFEALDREKFVESGFARKLPKKLKENILKYGIRNCNLTSIAPTGSISLVAGTSPSTEPCIAKAFIRRYNYRFDGKKVKCDKCNVIDPLWLKIRGTDKEKAFEVASDIGLEQHLEIQTEIQKWIDSSISKTANFKKGTVTRDDVKRLIKKYFLHLKGFTMLPEGSRKNSPQEPVDDETVAKWIENENYVTVCAENECKDGKCEL